ncbi:MAG TPA: universal stress protein [Gemmataceae bacterium]|nr:universal stress protein [Gemmataceae bacterium]
MASFAPCWNTILHCTDCREASRGVLLGAVGMAHERDARLIILHPVDTLGPDKLTHGEAGAQLQPSAYQQRRWDGFRRWVRELEEPGTLELVLHARRPGYKNDLSCWGRFRNLARPVGLFLREGDPVSTTVRTAAEHRCDLIVLAGQECRGWGDRFFRNVSEQIIRQAGCSVLVVRPPAMAGQPGRDSGAASRLLGPAAPRNPPAAEARLSSPLPCALADQGSPAETAADR